MREAIEEYGLMVIEIITGLVVIAALSAVLYFVTNV